MYPKRMNFIAYGWVMTRPHETTSNNEKCPLTLKVCVQVIWKNQAQKATCTRFQPTSLC